MTTCPYCAEDVAAGTRICPHCQSDLAAPPEAPRRRVEDDAAMRMLLPVGRSGWAIAAG